MSHKYLIIELVIAAFVLQSHVAGGRNYDVFHATVDDNAESVHQGPTSPTTYRLAKHFQSDMVLQRGPSKAAVYGFSDDIGGRVVVMMESPQGVSNYSAQVRPSLGPLGGVWSTQLDPMEAGVVVTLVILFPTTSVQLDNVIFGDVWLCSGQSNMEFTVKQMFNGTEEIANAHNFPSVRLMAVAFSASAVPLYDVTDFREKWNVPSNDTVSHFSAVCWLYGRLVHSATGIPMGMISTEWGGTPVEAWSSPGALRKCHVCENGQDVAGAVDNTPVFGPQNNSVLWNAMIYPFLPMTIYGALWYQGENDALTPEKRNRYNCTFPSMVADWRTNFHNASLGQTNATFPFGFVQLAANQDDPSLDHGFPDIRWHQTADVGYVPNAKMPNVFMAVALDLPDFHSPYGTVHPRDKMDVGLRLSYGGLTTAYNFSTPFQGPFPVHGSLVSEQFVIDYGTKWTLDIRNVEGFEFLCTNQGNDNDNAWESTNITRATSTSVTVSYEVCKNGYTPTSLRYNWRVSPCAFKKCAVYSGANQLPAPPFITDLKTDDFGLPAFRFDF